MQDFDKLIEITDRLLSPGGCPWDQEQTLQSVRTCALEEACEVIDAIDLDDDGKILEELGDFFFNAVFLAKMAEKEKRFTLQDVLQNLSEKLIRRHPHVFGDAVVENMEQFHRQWDAIKRKETSHERKSAVDGIPKSLPGLLLAHKTIKAMQKAGYSPIENEYTENLNEKIFKDEVSLGNFLFEIIAQARSAGIDAEQAIRKAAAIKEQAFRAWEKNKENK